MGFLPRSSFFISHLSKLSPFSTPHAQVPSPSSSSSSPPPPPLPPKDLMGTDSSGGSGSEEEEDGAAAEDLSDVGDGWALDDGDGDGDGGFLEVRDLVDVEFEGEGDGEEEDDEEAAEDLGVVGDGWALDDGDGYGGFLELPDLVDDGFLELWDLVDGERDGEEEEEELGDGEVVDGDGVLVDFGVLERELMESGDLLVGLEEVDRR